MLPKKRKIFSSIDYLLFAGLLLFLVSVVLTSAQANIQTDAIDYYAIVQHLIGDPQPVVPALPFIDQRSPGYPMLTLPVYSVLRWTTFWITPEIVRAVPPQPHAADVPRPSEQALLPPQPLLFREVFFKNFDLTPQGTWFKWDMIAAMLITSYGLFFAGLVFSAKTMTDLYPESLGASLAPLMVVSSQVFMHNLVNTPAYATLAVFGVSCLFTYFWVRGWQTQAVWVQSIAGVLAGLLVLTRLETVLIVAVLLMVLLFQRKIRFACYFVVGGLLPLALLLFYNWFQFGNPWYVGMLKGNMSVLTFDTSYVLATLVEPRSGILFWSAPVLLGIAGLLTATARPLQGLGWASLVLIALVALRVPVMYFCVGQGTLLVSGLNVTCPPDRSAMLEMIRFDANRYLIPLIPFAILGLRDLLGKIAKGISR